MSIIKRLLANQECLLRGLPLHVAIYVIDI